MKLNKKGFTLVELIVVMAIIAVLAAILVPTMLGFMNNAKFTQANANAKTIHTAMNAVISDYCTDNAALTGGQDVSLTTSAGTITLAAITGWTGTAPDMQQFLDGMTGNASIRVNTTGTGVDWVTWTLNATPPTAQVLKADQKANPVGTTALAGSDIVGGYPLG